MKKTIALALALLMLAALLVGCGADSGEADALRAQIEELQEEKTALEARLAEYEADGQDAQNGYDNPIDRFFDAVETDESTVAMNFKEGMRAEAWQAETEAEAERLKAALPLAEDRETVDAFLATLREQAGRIDLMSFYPCSDLNTPQSERLMTAGSILGLVSADSASRLYRDAYYQLYFVFPDALSQSSQPPEEDFVFDASAARATLAEGMGE